MVNMGSDAHYCPPLSRLLACTIGPALGSPCPGRPSPHILQLLCLGVQLQIWDGGFHVFVVWDYGRVKTTCSSGQNTPQHTIFSLHNGVTFRVLYRGYWECKSRVYPALQQNIARIAKRCPASVARCQNVLTKT